MSDRYRPGGRSERGEPDYSDYRPQTQDNMGAPDYHGCHGFPAQGYRNSQQQQSAPPYRDDYGTRNRPYNAHPPQGRKTYHDNTRYNDYDASQPRLRGSREAEDYRPYQRPSRDPPKPKSAPSISVIFLGLPPDVDSERLQKFLIDMGAAVESAVVIRDKVTQESKRFGFARFLSVEHARAFVEPNYPVVVWRETGSTFEGMRIKIDYSQTDKVQAQGPGFVEPERAVAPEPINDGTRDIGTAPTRYLFLRGLDSLVSGSEAARAFTGAIERKAAAESYQPGDGGLCRILSVKDRETSASWGFAFAEFADVKAAIEGLKTVMSPAVNPTGFKIGSTTVGVTFAHSDSFRLDYASSSWSIKDLETGRDIVYWDNKAFLEVFELPAARQLLEQRERHKSSQSQEPDPDEAFFASLEQDLDGGGQQQSKDIEAPLKQQPVTVPSVSLKSIALPTKKTEASTSTSQSNDGPKVGEKRKNREPELIAAKKNAISIDHWNKRKQEGEDTPAYEPVEEHIPDPLPYGDPVKFQCLLCSRQFKSIEMLQKHSDQSSLHKVQTNLNNQEAVDNAKEAKAKLQPAYRDRAAERRVALNQPDRPVSDKPSFKRVKAEALPATDSPPVQPNKDGIEEGNIGRKLLEAAGWSKGEGLGDAGKADPIEARQYQAGAGIGAAPSTAISDLPQDSNWNSAERGRDKARSRYIT